MIEAGLNLCYWTYGLWYRLSFIYDMGSIVYNWSTTSVASQSVFWFEIPVSLHGMSITDTPITQQWLCSCINGFRDKFLSAASPFTILKDIEEQPQMCKYQLPTTIPELPKVIQVKLQRIFPRNSCILEVGR